MKDTHVGERCALFRKEVLNISLSGLCRATGQNVKNISAFEHGRSSNLKYLFDYLQVCNEEQQKQFAHYVFGGVDNGN